MLKVHLQVDPDSQCRFTRLPVCTVTALLAGPLVTLLFLGVSFRSCKL